MFHTVLIVDDSPLIRRLIRSYLDNYPEWQLCGEAANGREGIEKAVQLHPDLIVMDLSMPVMNGIQAAIALKRLMPTIPVMIFSEYSSVFSVEEARAAGISALVSKAENLSVLLGKARALCQ
jgi:NarL family two-component system response regulator LiaR